MTLTGAGAVPPLLVLELGLHRTPAAFGLGVKRGALSEPAVFVQKREHADLSESVSTDAVQFWRTETFVIGGPTQTGEMLHHTWSLETFSWNLFGFHSLL